MLSLDSKQISIRTMQISGQLLNNRDPNQRFKPEIQTIEPTLISSFRFGTLGHFRLSLVTVLAIALAARFPGWLSQTHRLIALQRAQADSR
ncbi:MAG: hypothetical protein OHK0037_09360 [Elainellaceae cyanobacterium]